MKAVKFEQTGGVEVLNYCDVEVPELVAGHVLLKIEAVGVNYIDTYHRTGSYPVELPAVIGLEGAGVVAECGEGVTEVSVGDRVAYCGVMGSYAEYALVPAESLVPLPDRIDFEQGAAAMVQGMTAQYLVRSTYQLQEGNTCLVHAAAGGVGLLLVQAAKLCGARVFGTVSTKEKAELAMQAGADEVILYTQEDFEKRVRELTADEGVEVVYDSVAKDTFEGSLNCLKPRGCLALYGQSSGPIGAFDPQLLSKGGSLFMTRPALFDYIAEREELLQRASEVFTWIDGGQMSLRIGHRYPLSQAKQAHSDLEGRKTTGKIILQP